MKEMNHILSQNFVICARTNIFDIDSYSENMYKKYRRARDHCHDTGKYRGAAHNNCNLNHKELKEIALVFHNGSTYDYHFIIEELAKEFNGQFECLGEKSEKYITFFCTIKKKKLKFMDGVRCMSTLLSSLVNNLSDGFDHDKCTDCESCLY